MNASLLNTIVDAVLYEGYILYPYRASAKKNYRRFTFGRVYPHDFSTAQGGAEPCEMQTEGLFHPRHEASALDVTIRFLQPSWRTIGKFPQPPAHNGTHALPAYDIVPELTAGGKSYSTWQEAVERTVSLPPIHASSSSSTRISFPFAFPESTATEPILNDDSSVTGVILRTQKRIEGVVEVLSSPLAANVFKFTVIVRNVTPLRGPGLENQDEVIMRTLASTHTILHMEDGEFISLLDPPDQYKAFAEQCRNIGTYPVLVGEGEADRDTILSSPIILYDYPKIAPESAGNLLDGTEIDEILSLRIMTMTDDEKKEMRHVDEYARSILERTEGLDAKALMGMHGTIREMESFDRAIFRTGPKVESVVVNMVELRAGSRVRIHPRGRADIMDMALDGRTAVIETIEEDAEGKCHLALVLDDDPGKDLGMMRFGHRFFYGVNEVEPIGVPE